MQSRSHFLRHERCPKCAESGRDRKGNNLGVYSDGGTYCFSCGYGSGSTTEARLNKKQKEIKELPALPKDTDTKLPQEAIDWLHKYFNNTAEFPLCYWSEQERKLIFPIMESKQQYMIAWQYRYFGKQQNHPKWVGYGINDSLIYITGMGSNSLVLVEDLISGVKVGHIHPTLTLFGSNISLKRLVAIKLLGYTEVIIWLDWDKKEYAVKAAQLAQSIGLNSRVIHTKLDPKEFNYHQIQEYLK